MTGDTRMDIEFVAVVLLTLVYFLLALYRSASLELPPLRMGSVMRQAGRDDGILERWAASPHGHLLPLGAQVAFQGCLVLVTLLTADLTRQLLPSLSPLVGAGLAFLFTFVTLVIVVRIVLVRVLIALIPQAAVRAGARIAGLATTIMLPLLVPLDRLLSRWSTQAGNSDSERSEIEIEEEVLAFVSMGEEEGILEKEEGDLVRNVVDFGDTIVREIMTPRTEMIVVDRTARLDEVRRIFGESKYTRLPVQGESVDNMTGLLNVKDMLSVWGEAGDRPIADLVRPAMFVPETKKILDLLREMQQSQNPFALVVDEYGGTAGLVTVEDIVEEVFGEIQDEHDELREDISEESPGIWLVSGSTDIDKAAALVGLNVNGSDVETIGGLVTGLLGRVPEAGESLVREGVKLEVVAADDRRVLRLRLRQVTGPSAGEI
jgi:CBS domain containing-hemolysin-like protein